MMDKLCEIVCLEDRGCIDKQLIIKKASIG